MRFLFRWAFRLFLVIVVLVVALLLLKDVLAKAFAESQIRAQTGMDARIGKLEIGLLSPTITVEDLKVYNRAEFGGLPLLDAPDLYIEYSPTALALRTLRLKLVRLSLAEVNVVQARDGQTNVAISLDPIIQPKPATPTEAPTLFGLRFGGIETLNLTAGKVVYTSLRRPGESTEVNLGLKNEVLTNVTSVAELEGVLTRAALRNGITISPQAPDRSKGKGVDRAASPSSGGARGHKTVPGAPR